MNKTIELLKGHTSIRKFNEKKITEEEILEIIECAKRGATAGNMMAYSMISIKSKETLAKLAKSCDNQAWIAKAGFGLLFVIDSYKWEKYFEYSKVSERIENYLGPSVADFVLGAQDAIIAAQNAVVAAESLGIGTCYIGDIVENCEFHRELFNLPEYTMPLVFVVFGHYDDAPKLRKRFDNEYCVFAEEYPSVDEKFIEGMFSEYQEDYAYKLYNFKKNTEFFKEMNRSIKEYLKNWL